MASIPQVVRKMAWIAFCLVLTCVLGYVVYLQSTFEHADIVQVIIESEGQRFDLVKNDAPTLTTIPLVSAAPQIPFQEVFQVHQPVLTPEGVVDSTTNLKGSVETSLIDVTREATSCSQVLMEHDFAFSFGLPFVGMSLICRLVLMPC